MTPNLEKDDVLIRGRSEKDRLSIERAFEFAEEIHHGVTRVSGKPYIIHPLAVARRLASLHMPTAIVVAGMLHDTLEDTTRPQKEVKNELIALFGEDITNLIERVTKLSHNPRTSTYERLSGLDRYVENLRKMFVSFASDLRAIIIKFADRIENLNDLDVLAPEKRRRVALESLEVYAPIANRLGMSTLRVELEDLSFKHAYPDEYRRVVELVGAKYKSREGYLEHIGEKVKAKLDVAGIKSLIKLQARTKHYYSIYKKLLKYDWDINRIWDLFALRIIAKEIPDCYAALGVIHSIWKPVKGRIKDYIAQPKPNGYQSLHTTVFCEDGEFVEFQIRTQQMHEEAEYGIAAHWRYDETNKLSQSYLPHIDWVQELVKIQKEIENNKQFLETLEHMKIDTLKNRIFIYTPKGDVIELPEDATPVDFAYAVHTELGNTCVGAIVNEKNVALDTVLLSGDICMILTDKNRKGPSIEWLKFVKTRLAQEQIRAHAKDTFVDLLKRMVPIGKK